MLNKSGMLKVNYPIPFSGKCEGNNEMYVRDNCWRARGAGLISPRKSEVLPTEPTFSVSGVCSYFGTQMNPFQGFVWYIHHTNQTTKQR